MAVLKAGCDCQYQPLGCTPRVGEERGNPMSSFEHRVKNAVPGWLKEPARRLLSRWYFETVSISHPSVEFELTVGHNDLPPLPDWPFHNNHEPIVTEALVELLESDPDHVFWDIGSKYGYFPMVAATTTGRSDTIHVFEPEERHLTFIEANLDETPDRAANVIHAPAGEGADGTVSLDDYRTRTECPDIVKIDVDGVEENVLRGMRTVLADCRPQLFLEVHFMDGYDERRRAVREELERAGYECEICLTHRRTGSEWEALNLADLPRDNEVIPERAESQIDYMMKCDPPAD